jgi:hypothetical protein
MAAQKKRLAIQYFNDKQDKNEKGSGLIFSWPLRMWHIYFNLPGDYIKLRTKPPG